jgi:coatomer subunit epsilon
MYEPDELYVLRSRFYSGNYAQALSEAQSVVADSDSLTKLRDSLVLRSFVAQGDLKQAQRLLSSSPAATLYVTHKLGNSNKAEIESQLENVRLDDAMDKVFAALVYLELGNVKMAMKAVHGGESLEEMAITVLGLLKVDRVDLAEKTLAKMAAVDDDDVLVQIAKIWTSLYKGFAKGNEEFQEVCDSLNELMDKNGKTSLLLDLHAAAEMRNGNFAEAIKVLKESRSTAIAAGLKSGSVTLFNSLVTLTHIDPKAAQSNPDQPTLFHHVLEELKKTYPQHPYFEQRKSLEGLFDQTASKYKF